MIGHAYIYHCIAGFSNKKMCTFIKWVRSQFRFCMYLINFSGWKVQMSKQWKQWIKKVKMTNFFHLKGFSVSIESNGFVGCNVYYFVWYIHPFLYKGSNTSLLT
jgi:hypothetical protein